jgi:hypothetical protein
MNQLNTFLAVLQEGHQRLPDREVAPHAYLTVGLLLLFFLAVILFFLIRDFRR